MKKAKGFSLVELMVVVAIIGILAMIVYPSYEEHARKTRRTDGQSKLMEVMQAQERHYTVNYTYVTDLGQLGYSAATIDSDEGYYRISAAACGSGITSCVALTAVPQGPQTSDADLSLDSIGNKTPSDKW